ncbi:MAG: Jag N-terminal domain-containing protein, partial [Abditibacteriota bacterium]|nr:Jag N-terminal domain-containing protein [Abditibacteriota bacterium]
MEKIEATGRTLEEAIAVAAHNLGVGEDGIEYEVVEEGAKGFLGMGQQPTLINAWIKEEEAAETAPAASDATHTDAVCNLLTEILTAMGMNVECEITEDNEEEIDVSVSGEDTDLRLKVLHPTAPLYAGMSKRIGQLIDKYIFDNPDYFYN